MSEAIDLIGAGVAHAAVLAELHAACGDRPWSAAAYRDMLRIAGTGATIAARCADEPIGFGLWRRAADEGEILFLGVRGEYRRRGVAHAVLEHIHEQLRDRCVRTVHLEVHAGNRAARALYAKGGYRQTGRRVGYYGPRADALILSRPLAVRETSNKEETAT